MINGKVIFFVFLVYGTESKDCKVKEIGNGNCRSETYMMENRPGGHRFH
jgi:hypothetical protein